MRAESRERSDKTLPARPQTLSGAFLVTGVKSGDYGPGQGLAPFGQVFGRVLGASETLGKLSNLELVHLIFQRTQWYPKVL